MNNASDISINCCIFELTLLSYISNGLLRNGNKNLNDKKCQILTKLNKFYIVLTKKEIPHFPHLYISINEKKYENEYEFLIHSLLWQQH